MTIVDYNRQTGDFRYVIEENISGNAIEMLIKISEAKEESFTCDTLTAERELAWDKGGEEAGNKIQEQMDILSSLEDCGLVKQSPIYHEGAIKDMAYTITHVGTVLLNIRKKNV